MTTIDQIEQLIDEYSAREKIDLSKNKELLVKWGQALEAYETPVNFVMSTVFPDGTFEMDSKKYDAKRIFSPNNDQRRDLMSKQKQYVPKLPLSGYNVTLNIDKGYDFLSENVAQAEDSKTFKEVASNIVFEVGNQYVLPNRYPATWGHSLWIPKSIDDRHNRVEPVILKEENNRKQYNPEPRKTRGKILESYELKELFDLCDKTGYVAQRNHVLDAMSIPTHDHFHMQLEKMPSYNAVPGLLKSSETDKISNGIFRATNTPMDTLVISKDHFKGDFEMIVAYILGNMERDNQVFTLGYTRGNLMVSPRINNEDHKWIQVGAGFHMHNLDKTVEEATAKIKQYIPMKGEYNWSKYF